MLGLKDGTCYILRIGTYDFKCWSSIPYCIAIDFDPSHWKWIDLKFKKITFEILCYFLVNKPLEKSRTNQCSLKETHGLLYLSTLLRDLSNFHYHEWFLSTTRHCGWIIRHLCPNKTTYLIVISQQTWRKLLHEKRLNISFFMFSHLTSFTFSKTNSR